MRILVFNWQDREHPMSGGAETHLHEIFGRIARMGHHVTLLSCNVPDAPSETELDGIHVIRRGSRSTFNFTVPRWYRKNVAAMAPDVVVDDINKIPFFTPLFVRQPIVGIIHHLFGKSIYKEAGVLAGQYVRTAEKRIPWVYRNTPISVVSESTRQECIASGLRAENLSIIHNGIEPAAFPMRVGEKERTPTVIYFGRLKRYKSVDHIVRAIAIVRETVPKIMLRIVGRGDDEQTLRDLVSTLDLTNNVEFHGWVSGAEKIALLSSSHVAVNPSVKEGWGITNIEANACGTPVISADSPGLRDSVREGISGLLYPWGNIEMLARTLTRILQNSEERNLLSQGAVHWSNSFTWDESAKAMLDLCTKTAMK